MTSTLPAPIDKLAIVVVTYKRQELLANLFDSMTELTATPWRIVIVDNENSRETEAMCAAFNERLANLWGIDTGQPDSQGGTDRVIYAPQLENGGGAGGFSAGTKCAYDLGAQWFWVMDDDVLVIPEHRAPGQVDGPLRRHPGFAPGLRRRCLLLAVPAHPFARYPQPHR